MSKKYNAELQEQLEKFLKDENLSQAKAAPILGMSSSKLSQYRRSIYDGDIKKIEETLEEFFRIKKEQETGEKKANDNGGWVGREYIPTSVSEEIYKTIRLCQLQKGISVISGDSGIGKTKAAGKFLRDNPNTTVYVCVQPSTSSVRALLKMIARGLRLPENMRTEELSGAISRKLKQTDMVLIIDEAQLLKFMALEEVRHWTEEDVKTGNPGIGVVLIGNHEVYNRMLGKQEAVFAQQFSRTKLPYSGRTADIQKEDIAKFFPVLWEKNKKDELNFLYAVSQSKWGLRGMVNLYNNAVNNKDISLEGLKIVANTMGIRFI